MRAVLARWGGQLPLAGVCLAQTFGARFGLQTEVECVLVGRDQRAGPLQQHAQFGVGVGRSEVLEDVLFALGVGGDLYRCGTGFGAYSPDEGHPVTVEQPSLVRESAPSHGRTPCSQACDARDPTPVSQVRRREVRHSGTIAARRAPVSTGP